METDVAEVIKESLLNGFVTMINTPIPIGNVILPLWILTIGIILALALIKSFLKVRL